MEPTDDAAAAEERARALASQPGRTSVAELARLLRHRDADVRLAATEALGEIARALKVGTAEVSGSADRPTADLQSSPAPLSRRGDTASGRGHAGVAQQSPQLQEGGEAEELRFGLVTALCIALEDPNAHIRWAAARILQACPHPAALRPLIRRLTDDNKHVGWAAVDALEALGDPIGLQAAQKFKRARLLQGG